MIVQAAAKINLMLDVLGTLPDGYHSLFMIMQSVGCFDTVTVEHTGSAGEIGISAADARVPTDNTNIVYRAAEAFFAAAEIPNTGIRIAIDKKIPMAAGLAGGSADAAGTLYALNEMFSAGLSLPALQRISERVGADVPFALSGGTALCMDKGGVIAPLPFLEGKTVVLCKPEQDVSTVSAYKSLDALPRLRHMDKNAMLYAAHTGDYRLLCEKAGNVFEQAIEVPARPAIKGVMRACGADMTLMSGSGPTVYGLFSEMEAAQICAENLKKRYPETIVCPTVSDGVRVVRQ